MIDNKTILNTSLFSFLSSGAVDVLMDNQQSINNKPLELNPEKKEKIPVGDRYTLFLQQLFTDTFLINLELLGRHKTVFIKFITTKDFSFSINKAGNRAFKENIM